jgi:hypothetical protein
MVHFSLKSLIGPSFEMAPDDQVPERCQAQQPSKPREVTSRMFLVAWIALVAAASARQSPGYQ